MIGVAAFTKQSGERLFVALHLDLDQNLGPRTGGACEVDGSSVTGSVLGKRKRTNLEGMDPHRIARILAHEILIEADHRREL